MKKSLKHTIAGVTGATMMLGGILVPVTQTFAAYSESANTEAVYTNQKIIPGSSGYGIAIPTKLSFDANKHTADAKLKYVPDKGHSIEEWKKLQVDVKVESANNFTMTDENGNVGVKYNLEYETDTPNTFQVFDSDSTVDTLTKKIGLTRNATTLEVETRCTQIGGTANVTNTDGVADDVEQYKDLLTYTITESESELMNP